VLAKDICAAVRTWKSDRKFALNEPLESIEVIGADKDLLPDVLNDIAQTTKAKQIKAADKADLEERIQGIKPLPAKIGPTFRAKAAEVTAALKQVRAEEMAELLDTGSLQIPLSDGTMAKVTSDFVEVEKLLVLHGRAVETVQLGDILIAISK
jgi:valyl-tRNA synthetase